jgi:hypothetical protein
MNGMDSLGMTTHSEELWGKEAAAIHMKIDFLIKMNIESPQLPSPFTPIYSLSSRFLPQEQA